MGAGSTDLNQTQSQEIKSLRAGEDAHYEVLFLARCGFIEERLQESRREWLREHPALNVCGSSATFALDVGVLQDISFRERVLIFYQ